MRQWTVEVWPSVEVGSEVGDLYGVEARSLDIALTIVMDWRATHGQDGEADTHLCVYQEEYRPTDTLHCYDLRLLED